MQAFDSLCIQNYRYRRTLHILVKSFVSVQWRAQQFCSGGVQQIQLRTEGREKGGLGGGSALVRGPAQFANE
jgi:hypothetical protein